MALYLQSNSFSGQLDESLRANGVLREYSGMRNWVVLLYLTFCLYLVVMQKRSSFSGTTSPGIGLLRFVQNAMIVEVTLTSLVLTVTSFTATLIAVDPTTDVTMISYYAPWLVYLVLFLY
jgi:hypothetical protein